MTDFIPVNRTHLELLTPLLKWRILDLDCLRKEAINVQGKHNFYRFIRDLEKKKILIGFRNPYTKKKYVYLSPIGEGQFSLQENPTAISTSSLSHDTKVSEICRELLEQGFIEGVELEHQLQNKKQFLNRLKVIPDALLVGKKNGVEFKIAFELELTQKNTQRIIEKARQYLVDDSYDYVLYFFLRAELMKKYKDVLEMNLQAENMKRFMFFYSQNLMEKNMRIGEAKGILKGREMTLKELFS